MITRDRDIVRGDRQYQGKHEHVLKDRDTDMTRGDSYRIWGDRNMIRGDMTESVEDMKMTR